ncbi:MAG: type IV pilus modification protein PilV [Burkholderiaceae bacterium]
MQPPTHRRATRGFALLEVLVAVLVFVLGLLALAGTLLASLRSTHAAQQASAANGLARDYRELMLMTPRAALPASTFEIDTAGFTRSQKLCTAATCTPDELVAFMQTDWSRRVETSLPGGRALVCRDSAPRRADGSLRWECDGQGALTVKLGWFERQGPGGANTVAVAQGPRVAHPLAGVATGSGE